MAEVTSKRNFHVITAGARWSVMRSGAQRASLTVNTQREAITIARQRAERDGTTLFIHGRDGRVRRMIYCGKTLIQIGLPGPSPKSASPAPWSAHG